MAEARTTQEALIASLFSDSDQLIMRMEELERRIAVDAETLPAVFAKQTLIEIEPLVGKIKTAVALASDNIESGIMHGTATALVEVNQILDKLNTQSAQYEKQSAELEKGLGQLVENFQKSANGILVQEMNMLSNDMRAAGASFRQRMVEDQQQALTAIAEAKKNQTWGAVWQLVFALAIGLIGGVAGSNIHAINTNAKINNLEHLIMDQRSMSMK